LWSHRYNIFFRRSLGAYLCRPLHNFFPFMRFHCSCHDYRTEGVRKVYKAGLPLGLATVQNGTKLVNKLHKNDLSC
jgi:hypothetical protein